MEMGKKQEQEVGEEEEENEKEEKVEEEQVSPGCRDVEEAGTGNEEG